MQNGKKCTVFCQQFPQFVVYQCYMKVNLKHPIRRVLVVEEDPTYRKLVEYITKLNPDYEVHSFSSGKECLENLHLNPTIITVEHQLPDMTGREFLTQVKKHDENIAVIVISNNGDIPTIVDMIKRGAYDYLRKSDELRNQLLATYNRIKLHLDLRKDVRQFQETVDQNFQFNETIKGESPAIKRIYKLLEKASKTDINVVVTGETGTGKELAAQAIHFNSKRKKHKFVAVNCAAIPRDLLESELFGYEKGAFTGAQFRKLGQFEFADKGTLFLDEIGEMDISLQAKLLRVLQEKEFQRVGGTEPVKFDARIVVATHRSLTKEVAAGKFRQDLFYRLMGLPIELPPLQDRGKDILILADYFLNNFCRKNEINRLNLTKEAQKKLQQYRYPGNVRELKATVELAAVLTDENYIDAEHISFQNIEPEQNFLLEEVTLKEYTERIIHHYLNKYNDNVVLVAKKLGIGKSTIYRLLKETKEKE